MPIQVNIFENIKLINALSLKVNCSLGAWCLSPSGLFFSVFIEHHRNLFKSDLMCAIKNQFPKVFSQFFFARNVFYFISFRDAVKINNLWSQFYVFFAIKKEHFNSNTLTIQRRKKQHFEKQREWAWNSICFCGLFRDLPRPSICASLFTLWMFNYTSAQKARNSVDFHYGC